MRDFHQSILVMAIISATGAVAEPVQRGICWGHGKTAEANGFHNYSTPQAFASLAALKRIGANWVSPETAWYQAQCTDTELLPKPYTPDDASLEAMIQYANSLGLKVLLNAHIEVSCMYDGSCKNGCRGRTGIDFGRNISAWDAWFASYTAFAVHYGRLCERAGCAGHLVHVELQDIGAALPDITQRWLGVIAAVRRVFSGTLSASVNSGDTGTPVLNQGYWEALDYIGVDTFPDLGSDVVVSSLQTRQTFEALLQNLVPLCNRTGKQIILTQIGYPSCIHCGEKGAHNKFQTVNMQCQCNAYQGLLEAVWSSPIVAGLYWWNWLPCVDQAQAYCQIGANDNGESPQEKGAQDVLANFYGGHSSIRACANLSGRVP